MYVCIYFTSLIKDGTLSIYRGFSDFRTEAKLDAFFSAIQRLLSVSMPSAVFTMKSPCLSKYKTFLSDLIMHKLLSKWFSYLNVPLKPNYIN